MGFYGFGNLGDLRGGSGRENPNRCKKNLVLSCASHCAAAPLRNNKSEVWRGQGLLNSFYSDLYSYPLLF